MIIKLNNSLRNDFSDLIGLDVEIGWEDLKKERRRGREELRREKVLSRQYFIVDLITRGGKPNGFTRKLRGKKSRGLSASTSC